MRTGDWDLSDSITGNTQAPHSGELLATQTPLNEALTNKYYVRPDSDQGGITHTGCMAQDADTWEVSTREASIGQGRFLRAFHISVQYIAACSSIIHNDKEVFAMQPFRIVPVVSWPLRDTRAACDAVCMPFHMMEGVYMMSKGDPWTYRTDSRPTCTADRILQSSQRCRSVTN